MTPKSDDVAAAYNIPRPKEYLMKASRIVVKVGTSNLTEEDSKISEAKIKRLVDTIMALKREGREVFLVTSGAIASGLGALGLKARPRQMPFLQAAASIGQSILMKTYAEHFAKYNQMVAQLLLTKEDFMDEHRHQNLMNTLEALITWGVLPIVNENDTVAVDEIRFGDNDNLAALLSISVKADLLVLLSDVDGIYTSDPNLTSASKPIRTLTSVTPELEAMAGGAHRGSGGLITKLQAAKVTLQAGIPMAIVNGEEPNAIQMLLRGEMIGTLFVPMSLVKVS
ncbi:MAG: glutamate 5-kinase [Nitrososphaerales archaeon]